MKLYKKVLSMIMSVTTLFTVVATSPVISFAAGSDTVLHTLFTETNDPVIPEQLTYDASKDCGLDETGLVGYNWSYYWPDNGTKYGFPESAKNVYRVYLNATEDQVGEEASAKQTSLMGREVVTFGVKFFTHEGGWGEYTNSVSAYSNTAALTVKLNVSEKSYVKDMYVYMKSGMNNTYGFTGVKLSDKYYTEEDAGKVKTLSIPISEFVNAGENAHKINGGFNPENFAGAGIMLVNPSSTTSGWVAYDDLYVCNVEKPTNLKMVDSTTESVEISWDPSMSDIDHYEILRNGKIIGETSDIKFSDKTESRKNYTYEVQAVDKYGAHSVSSNTIDVYTSSTGAPKNFKVKSSFADSLKAVLSWEKPSYGVPVGYEIYRDDIKIADVDADTFEYSDESNDLKEDTFYTYYVKAKSDSDVSMASESRYIMISYISYPDNVEVDTTSKDIKISWDKVDSAFRYLVYRNDSVIATIPAEEYEYTDTEWEYSTAYTYYICAVNEKGRTSYPSKKITVIKYPDNQRNDMVFDDSITSGYYINSIGASKAEVANEQYALGEKSLKVSVNSGSFDAEGAAIVSTAKLDLTKKRMNGGRIEFFVYADESKMLDNIMVGFGCASDPLNGKSYTARCGVNLSDYITKYGLWNYVSIPLSDFPIMGSYAEDISNNRLQRMKYNEIEEIDFYSVTPHYLVDKSFYIDDIKLADFVQPQIVSVSDQDGTKITSNSIITKDTKTINFEFDTEIDASSVAGNIILKSADTTFALECNVNGKTVSVTVPRALKKSTAYSVIFDEIKSINGAYISNCTFDFSTDESEYSEYDEMSDTEYILLNSENVTRGKDVKVRLTLDSDKAKNAAVNAVDIEIKYDYNVLKCTGNNIAFTKSLQNATAVVDNSQGIIDIKVDKSDKIFILGDYIADITFTAERAGVSNIDIAGSLSQAVPEKTVTLAQKFVPQITVTTYTNGSSGGSTSSSGGGFGGGRSEATAKPESGVSVTDSSTKGNIEKRMFSDSADFLWAEKAIEDLGKKGVLKGYEDGTFRPDKNVTREEFVAMIVRALFETDETAVQQFADVEPSAWYASDIATAVKLSITDGKGDMFGVGEYITRQDMCTMLVRAAKASNISLPTNYNTTIFADEYAIADYAKDSVSALQHAGIINGIEDNLFAPDASANRAMAAKVIYMLMQMK